MDKKKAPIIAALFAVAALIMTVQTVFADHTDIIEKGSNYDKQFIGYDSKGNKIYELTLGKPERILDGNIYRDYILYQDQNVVELETANSGSLRFDRNTCSYNFYNAGHIDQSSNTKIKNISWTVKGKEATNLTWSNLNGINGAACNVSVQTTESTVRIIGSKSNGLGEFQIVLDYVPGNGIKETMRGYNNNPTWNNHNIGFTETFEVPRVINMGNRTFDLADYNNTSLGRTWIQNNDAKLVRLTDNILYDFGIGFENLDSIKIYWNGSVAKLALNYLFTNDIVPYQTWFEVDPTFGYTVGTSTNVRATLANCATGSGADSPGTNYIGSDATYCYRTGVYWDITVIDDAATINDIDYRHDVGAAGGTAFVCDIMSIQHNLSTMSNQQRYLDIGNGTTFVNNNVDCDVVGTDFTVDLGASADADLQSHLLIDNEWGIGLKADPDNGGGNAWATQTNPEIQITYTIIPPNAVEDLAATEILDVSVDLDWTTPDLNGGNATGYQINDTTPWGDPLTVLVNDTGTNATAYMVSGLTRSTQYSFRVSVWTEAGNNATGNILNVTTLPFVAANFTIGTLNINVTNPDITPIRFNETALNTSATNLEVIYSNAYNMSCNFYFEFALANSTYTNLAGGTYDSDHDSYDFTFLNPSNEVITVRCWDINTNTTGRYVIVQSEFPLLQQIQNFRAGEYGTSGLFGAIDFITLAVVILSMIGFNRVNETVGAILNVALLGALAYFTIIELPTLVFGFLAIVIMVIVAQTRKE